MRTRISAVAGILVFLAGCSSQPPQPPEEAKPAASSEAKPSAAPPFRVRFETSKGPFVVEVHPEWAPIGAKRFQDLVNDRYYDGARFFRVVPNFVVQFGLAGDPKMTKKWDKAIPDDPVVRTNRGGSVAFATMGPNTRTAQMFINLRTNESLDSQGFAPFGQVVEGMQVVERLYSGYGEAPDQQAITNRGNAYLQQNFPKLDYVKTAQIQ